MALDNESTNSQIAVEEDSEVEVESYSALEEMSGKIGHQDERKGLMHSVLENDKDTIEEGRVISDSINQGVGSFTPELMMSQLVNNYSSAKKLYGKRILRFVSGYEPDYIERNIRIPEFQRELEKRIGGGIQKLKKDGLIDSDGFVEEKGVEVAALVMYVEELKELKGKGLFGDQSTKKKGAYGERGAVRAYRKGDRYRDIALQDSAKLAIRRGHQVLEKEDLKSTDRLQKGRHELIYALDASGSMKGDKIELAKKAGIALAYHAINRSDKVGLMVFGSDVSKAIPPTGDFAMLLKEMVKIRPGQETNLAGMMEKAIPLFSTGNHTKHLLILTDAVPTVGADPATLALKSASSARAAGITISMVGVGIEEKGATLAKDIVKIGQGILYTASSDEAIDRIVLDDYFRITA